MIHRTRYACCVRVSFSFPSNGARPVVFVGSGLPPSSNRPRCPRKSSSAPVSPHPFRRFCPTICISFASKQVLSGQERHVTDIARIQRLGTIMSCGGRCVSASNSSLLGPTVLTQSLTRSVSGTRISLPKQTETHTNFSHLPQTTSAHTNLNAPSRPWPTLNMHSSRPPLPQHRVCDRLSNQCRADTARFLGTSHTI
ncbi:hypothetical protein CY34DRAFT_600180 [Suillus luteus UH-Slu-Lm8-n1]|uniref:Uncharacterized protein n=1 Tax=Suillus luteus UH-Slu-Lm8-n1 TaxID=930992 RepID=A0A0D0AT31_9AGAM|nr:hypothetical protein CY34DRAFT_600180 [Suillus luteus UH-Slu-Lm8-n1]